MKKIGKSVGAQRPIEFKDLDYIKNYQIELINYMLYCTRKDQELMRTKLMSEIQNCEHWLKKHFNGFINDNNRKYEAA